MTRPLHDGRACRDASATLRRTAEQTQARIGPSATAAVAGVAGAEWPQWGEVHTRARTRRDPQIHWLCGRAAQRRTGVYALFEL